MTEVKKVFFPCPNTQSCSSPPLNTTNPAQTVKSKLIRALFSMWGQTNLIPVGTPRTSMRYKNKDKTLPAQDSHQDNSAEGLEPLLEGPL